MLERLAGLVADVLHHLRQRLEAVANLGYRPALVLHHREHLQGRDQSVAGGGVIRQDHVSRGLAADVEAVLAHIFEHVAVADRRARQRKPQAGEVALQPEIGHDGGDDPGFAQPAVAQPAFGDDRHQLVAVDQMAFLVGDDDAVAVAVERDADIRAHFPHLLAQRLGGDRSAFLVDVEAVGLDPDRDHLGAELPQRRGCDPVCGAVGAIDHHAQPADIEVPRQRALGGFDIAIVHAVDALGPPELGALGQALG